MRHTKPNNRNSIVSRFSTSTVSRCLDGFSRTFGKGSVDCLECCFGSSCRISSTENRSG